MSALDLSQRAEVGEETGSENYSLYDGHQAHTLLHELATVYSSMDRLMTPLAVYPHIYPLTNLALVSLTTTNPSLDLTLTSSRPTLT